LLSETNESYLASVRDFVDRIDKLVGKLQVYSEKKLQNLAMIGGFGLGGVLVVSLYILLIVRRRVLEPVNGLIEASQSIQRREFDIHLKPSGSKEMDFVGRSFTSMSQELGQLYDDLESAVEQKTSELQQANASLSTLYRTTSLLADPSLNYSLFQTILDELVSHPLVAGVKATVLDESDVDVLFVSGTTQAPLKENRTLRYSGVEQGNLTLFLLAPVDESFIESFTQIYSRAIYYKATKKQQQQLLIHTERATIARELHDSLAQNLSYLKIQTVLLKREFSQHPVVLDLDEGLRSCYQQLRELLKTFRLPVGELNFAEALKTTVEDLQGRTEAAISYNNQLNSLRLTAEQHVHVLQIIRESTLNAAKHAKAKTIKIGCIDEGDRVCITVEDDGRGFDVNKTQDGHYGLAILHERAEQLGGTMKIESTIGQGSMINMCFEPQA
jgi:two-component system nitrate/nitrite sensor histidine kinase NarQ